MTEHDSASPSDSNPDYEQDVVVAERRSILHELRYSEDWWAVWIGGFVLAVAFLAVYLNAPDNLTELRQADSEYSLPSPIKTFISKPGTWRDNPVSSIYVSGEKQQIVGILGVFGISLVLFGFGLTMMRKTTFGAFCKGFWFVFLLATIAYILTGQEFVKQYNLEYALWALGIGLVISNTVGTPQFVRPAVQTEFYIKTGLVILGAGVLLSKLIALGVPGIFVAWIVTPIVLISTYVFGQKVLKMESKSLNMVISADMSVCGVSAAIATAAACKAKKEELSFAIGLSLTFTVIMMIVLPAIIKAVGMSEVLGGAWIGGTIDSTGAVGVSGALLGETAEKVAVTIKMIQNILIGVTAFGVAVFWVSFVEKEEGTTRPRLSEIWVRFPKFVLGFAAASIIFSILYSNLPNGDLLISTMKASTKTLRGWFFCLAFVSIGLDTNFRELAKYLKGGKPMVLYACGQSLNLILTLFMAWLMFEVVFRESIQQITGG